MINLYTDTTPNGFKVSICLEEMALPYQLTRVNLLWDFYEDQLLNLIINKMDKQTSEDYLENPF